MNRLEQIYELLEATPDDPFLQYALALEYKKEVNTNRACSTLKQLLQEHPNYVGTYYQLGVLLLEHGEDDKALEVFRKGLPIAQDQNEKKIASEIQEAILTLE